MIFLTDDDGARDRLRPVVPVGRSLVGGVSELIDLLGRYVALGVDEFAVPDFTLGGTAEQRMDMLQRIHAEVLSAF